jgi:hypothetical protein
MAENRLARELESREENMRPTAWQPPQLLPDPAPKEGISYRWVRISTMGQSDPTNASAKFREGWEPCKLIDHPELKMHTNPNSQFKENIEIGGLLLCQMASEKVRQRREYYTKMADQQMGAVDNSFLKANDPRMPMDALGPAVSRKSTTTFGRGRPNS